MGKESTIRKNRIYAVAPYYPNSENKMVPEFPDNGPCKSWDDCPCVIYQDHYRERQTGPEFPLLVVRCVTHKVAFTIYPYGFTPFGRSCIAPVAIDGSISVEGEGAERFVGTYFDAALDANQSLAWWHQYTEDRSSPHSFITQTRHLKRICKWFGIDPNSDQQQRDAIITLLDVPGQLLYDNSPQISKHPGYQNQGIAICNILEVITIRNSLFERFAALGSNISLWPVLEIWDNSNKSFRPSSFQALGTRAPPD